MNNKKPIDRYHSYLFIGEYPKTKTQKVWDFTKLLSGLVWGGTKFVVKNAPTAIGVAWEKKKEFTEEVSDAIQKSQKEQKLLDLENEIKSLNPTKRGK